MTYSKPKMTSRNAIYRAEEAFEAIMTDMQCAVWQIAVPGGRLLRYCRSVEDILGVDLGKHLNENFFSLEGFREGGEALNRFVAQLMSGQRSETVLPYTTPEGRRSRLQIRSHPDGEGGAKGMLLDVTDASNLEKSGRYGRPRTGGNSDQSVDVFAQVSGGPAENGKTLGKRILLVEDDPLNRQYLKNFLSCGGYEVIEAGDGFEAVNTFKKNAGGVDLILMDPRMPQFDGLEAIKPRHLMEEGPRVLPLEFGYCCITLGGQDLKS